MSSSRHKAYCAATSSCAVRWGVAGRIVWAWVLTIPAAAILSMITFYLLDRFVSV